MKIKILLTLGLLSFQVSFAQQSKTVTLKGQNENEVVPYARVQNLRTKQITGSSDQGKVTITGSPKDSIQIDHSTYATVVYLFENIGSEIKMTQEEDLDELMVIQNLKPKVELEKLPIRNLDAPVTYNRVTSQIIEQRGVTDLGGALKSATGVRPINRYGGFQTFRMRGFNNFVLLNDGVRDERHNLSTSAPSTNLANVESIEVLKGPASVLFGHSALGGIINIVRKKPTDVQKAEFSTAYGSFNTYEMSTGVGGPISERLRYRVDFGLTRTDGWRDFGSATNNATIAFDYTPAPKHNLKFSFQTNHDRYDTDTGIPVDTDGSIVEGMDPETRYNDPQDYLIHKRFDAQLKYSYAISENMKLTNHFSWSDDDINYLSTEWLYFNDAKDSITRGFPFYFNHTTATIQNQLDLSVKYKTGTTEHHAVVGYSISSLDRKTFGGSVEGPGTFTTVSVQNPTLNQGHIEAVDNNVRVTDELSHGIYWQNWTNISKKLKALIGLRYDFFTGTYYRDQIDEDRNLLLAGERTEIPSGALSYRGGLVYQPLETMSIFASYSNYFKPSRRVTPNGQIFDPESGYQIEGGVKIDQGDKVVVTISPFYILKHNIVERNTVNEYHQIGEADSKGVEFDLAYQPIEGLFIKGGYAYVDAKVRSFDVDSLQATRAGNQLRYAPKHMANLWVNYNIRKKVDLGFGGNYVSENFTNSDNSYALPEYFTLDANVSYTFKNIRIGVNVNNILDKLYFTDAIYGNQFFPGVGRNFKLKLKYLL